MNRFFPISDLSQIFLKKFNFLTNFSILMSYKNFSFYDENFLFLRKTALYSQGKNDVFQCSVSLSKKLGKFFEFDTTLLPSYYHLNSWVTR